MAYAWLWMNLPPGIPTRVGFANQVPRGLAHYTVRSFERPFISHSVRSKIEKQSKEVNKPRLLDIHISFTQDINKMLISPEQDYFSSSSFAWVPGDRWVPLEMASLMVVSA